MTGFVFHVHQEWQEIGEGDRDRRIKHAKSYVEEAKSIRKRIKANEKTQEKLQCHRSEIEEQMREIVSFSGFTRVQ